MDRKLIDSISKDIFRKYPEVNGIQPEVRAQGQSLHLLIFKGKAKTEDGHSITRTVRVVVDENGKIVKTTTSR
jgi:hypothetical protein